MKTVNECFGDREIRFLKAIYLVFTKQKEYTALERLKRLGDNFIVALSGKDSIAALDLATRAKGPARVIINKYVGQREVPRTVVEELADIAKIIGAGEIHITEYTWGSHGSLFTHIVKDFDVEYIITGLRRQEDDEVSFTIMSRVGMLVRVVSPIGDWRHSDVWSYLLQRQIPVPDAYCSIPPICYNPLGFSLQSLIFQ